MCNWHCNPQFSLDTLALLISVTDKIILQLAVVMNITKVGTYLFQQQLHSKSCFTLSQVFKTKNRIITKHVSKLSCVSLANHEIAVSSFELVQLLLRKSSQWPSLGAVSSRTKSLTRIYCFKSAACSRLAALHEDRSCWTHISKPIHFLVSYMKYY